MSVVAVAEAVADAVAVAVVRLWFVVVACFLLMAVVVVVLVRCGFVWWVLCDVQVFSCVVLCRVVSSSLFWCCRRCVLWCRAALSWWSESCLVNSVNERDLSLLKGFRCGSYLITSWMDNVCVTKGSLRQ